MEQNQKHYYAFISYKREDEKWAKWLQHKLEHYRFPTNLNGRTDLPKNIRPTFRDVTDLEPGILSEKIDAALRDSQWLIVICSPRSAKSPWVCKEAQTFIDLGRADHIIPFIIEGIPQSNNPVTECYPEAILHMPKEQELLGANINEMGRDAAKIKVVSRMFGLKFDTLWQRHEREQRKRRGLIYSLIAIFIIFLLMVSGYIWKSRHELQITYENLSIANKNTENERMRAEQERDRAEAAEDSLRIQYEIIEQSQQNLTKAYDSIHNQIKIIEYASQELNEQFVKSASNEAKYRLEQGDIIGACHKIQSFVNPKDTLNIDGTLHPSIKQVLHIIYDSLNIQGVRTKPIGVWNVDTELSVIRFSKDGRYLVFATKLGYVSIIDVENGFNLLWEQYILNDITSIDIHPITNEIAVTSEKNGSVVCTDAGGITAHLGKKKYSRSIRFSNDGKYLAVTSLGNVEIYSTDNYKRIKYISYDEMQCDEHIWSVDFNKTSSEILIATNKECFSYDWILGNKNAIYNNKYGNKAIYSKDYKSVVQWGGSLGDDYINIYDAVSTEKKYSYNYRSRTNCWMNKDVLLYLNNQGEPIFKNTATNETIFSYQSEGSVITLDVHPNGSFIAAGSMNKVCLYPIEVYYGSNISDNNEGTECADLSPNKKYYAHYMSNGKLVVFDVEQFSTPVTVIPNLKGESFCFTPDSKHLIIGTREGKIGEWDLQGNLIRIFADSLPGKVLESMVMTGNSRYLFVSDEFGHNIYKFDYMSGRIVKTVNCMTSVKNIHLNNANTQLISSHADAPNCRIWDVDSLIHKISVLPMWSMLGNDAIFSHNDQLIAVASYNPIIYVINIKEDKRIELKGHTGASGVAFLTFIDNRTLASYGSDNLVIVWDLNSTLPLHKYYLKNGYPTSCCYIPSKKYIITGSRHGSHILYVPSTNDVIEFLNPFFIHR